MTLQVDPFKNILAQDIDRTLYLCQNRNEGEMAIKEIHKAEKVSNIRLFGKFLVSNCKRDLFYHLLENKVCHFSGEEKKLQTTYTDKVTFEKIMDIEIEDLPAMNALLYMTNKAGDIWAIKHPGAQLLHVYKASENKDLIPAEYLFLRGGPENQHLLVLVGYSKEKDKDNKDKGTHSIVARIFNTAVVSAYTATSIDPTQKMPVKLTKLQDFEFKLEGNPGGSKEESKLFYPQYVNMKSWYSTPTQARYTNILVIFLMNYHSFFVVLLQKNAMDQPYKYSSRAERLPEVASTLKVSHGVAIPNNEKYQLSHSLFLLFRNNMMLRLKIDFSKF